MKIGGKELVLTVFTNLDCPPTQVACSRHSWLAEYSNDSDDTLVTVEKFTDDVDMCTDLSIDVQNDEEEFIDNKSDKFKSSVRYHLAGLVITESSQIYYNYFGVKASLKVSVGKMNVNDVSNFLQNLRLNSDGDESNILTSTPHKKPDRDPVLQSSKTYYRVSSNTNCNFVSRKKDIERKTVKFVGGLDKELDLMLSHVKMEFISDRRMVTGMLLYGPPGTGKTLLAESFPLRLGVPMVRITGPEIFSKFYGETENKLREKFEEAKNSAPSIIFLDEIDSLAPRRDNGSNSDQERRVIASLLTLLDDLHHGNHKVMVLAATCKLDAVDPSLRRPGRLDMEVEIGVPNVLQRADILRGKLKEVGSSLTEDQVDKIASDTHGFVGADIEALVSYASMQAKESKGQVVFEHFAIAKTRVKPSGMREVMVEIPRVTWDDIGGLEELKLKLRQAVEWPIKHPEVFTRMGITPPKGLLMYGPPGCSKTMIAKALANESGLNFLSIKGPELFSKWVGESERAVREVFRKARQVKPSIVFFDEIDAVGGSRGGGGGGGGKVGDRVLAQLLTEMDGVESLTGVTVVAATNRPDMMDTALLRPGRLDRVVFVPLPDLDTRKKVLTVHTRKIPVSKDLNLEEIATRTEGYSGAEIAAVCNEAALSALEENVNIDEVTEKHFEIALNNLKPRISKDLFKIYDKFQSDHHNKAV